MASDLPTPGDVESAALLELPLAAQPPLKVDFDAPHHAETTNLHNGRNPTPPKPGRKDNADHVEPAPLSEYELHRNKRIAANQAFLESLGLGDNGQKLPKKPSAKRKREPKPKVEEHEKRSVRAPGGRAGAHRAAPGRPAVVRRLRGEPAAAEAARARRAVAADGRAARQTRRVLHGRVLRLPRDDDQVRSVWKSNFRRPTPSNRVSHRLISSTDNNRKTVIRQVTKLVTGVGVDYHRWPAGVVFRKGEPVTLQDDLVQIKEDAKEFEAEHGRDLGNGWLLNHPLQKMILFRDHLAATKLPGKARKKTKAVPRAPSSDDDDDDDEAAAAPPEAKPAKGTLTPETVRAIREAKKRFDEGEIDEATFKETKAGLLMVGRAGPQEIPWLGLVRRRHRKRRGGRALRDRVVGRRRRTP